MRTTRSFRSCLWLTRSVELSASIATTILNTRSFLRTPISLTPLLLLLLLFLRPDLLAQVTLPVTRTVLNTSDSGPGSLRAVLAAAGEGDRVVFAPNVTGTIPLTSGELLIDKPLAIQGPGARILTVSGGGLSRLFRVAASGVSISGLAMRDGRIGTTAFDGGGAIKVESGTVAVTNCVLANCGSGAGTAARGGAVQVLNGASGILAGCTLSGNRASGGSAVGLEAGSLQLIQCTLTENSASPGGPIPLGGAVLVAGGSASLLACTIAGNSDTLTAGGVLSSAACTIRNCVIAGNQGGDVSSGVTSAGHNLVGAPRSGATFLPLATDLAGTVSKPLNALLGPLQDNGGQTLTMALYFGSPGLEAGDDALVNLPGLTTDQRGQSRLSGCHVDIGAHESLVPSCDLNFAANLNDHGGGSLREAIARAPAGGAVTFLYGLGRVGAITLTSGEILINKNLTIQGPGADQLTISGGDVSRVFNVAAGATVALSGLSLTHGRVVASELGACAEGGAVLNQGTLRMTNCTFVLNRVVGAPGTEAFLSFPAGAGGCGQGGAIANHGDLTVMACTFADNHAQGGVGGGGNSSVPRGGLGGAGRGGAIWSGTGRLSVFDSTVVDSSALGGAGGAGTDLNGGHNDTAVGGFGGAAAGGGILALNGAAEVRSCTLWNNHVTGGVGGRGGNSGNGRGGPGGAGGLGSGGGLWAGSSVASPLLANCTVYANGVQGGGGGSGGTGFGWPNGAAGAVGLGQGGGMHVSGGSGFVPRVYACTITENSASGRGGTVNGGGLEGRAECRSSIVAENFASGAGFDCAGDFTGSAFNLVGIGDGSAGFTVPANQVGSLFAPVDPWLAPFDYYGGPTRVLPLLPDSPALDQGINVSSGADQRGLPRPVDDPLVVNASGGDGTDIGAYERGPRLVTNLNNDGPGSLRLTIREAGPDEPVRFAPGLSGVIALSSGEIDITRSIRIEGPGPGVMAVSGNNASRVFRVRNTTFVHMSGLTIRDGLVVASGVDANNNGNEARGGGILSEGILHLTNCFVISNRVVGAAGPLNGTANRGFGGAAWGGGIFHNGYDAREVLNSAGNGYYIVGQQRPSLRLDRCTVRGNVALGGISGAGPNASGLSGGWARGGGIASEGGGAALEGGEKLIKVELVECTIDGNVARGGAGRTAFNNTTGGNARAGGHGGQAHGGGLYSSRVRNFDWFKVMRCTLSGNTAMGGDGGTGGSIENCLNCRGGDGGFGGKAYGGGLFETESITAYYAILNSTVTGNLAQGGNGGLPGLGPGAGFFGVGGDGGFASGGGIEAFDTGLASDHCTITANTARGGAGAMGIDPPVRAPDGSASGGGWSWTRVSYDPQLALIVTIVAGNLAQSGAGLTSEDESDINFDHQGRYNLIGRGRIHPSIPDTGVQLGGRNGLPHPLDPRLGPLRNNGGFTLTHGLAPGSPALDKGVDAGWTVDQRGFPRTVDHPGIANGLGDGSDIGAVEQGLESIQIVDSPADQGVGTLRQAILEANATPGSSRIDLGLIAGTTLDLLSPLPAILQPVIIDGSMRSNASGGGGFDPASGSIPVPGTVLNGAAAGAGAHGLILQTSNVVVRGLVIQNFSGHGILLSNASGCVLEGNYIGTDATGTTRMPNDADGIRIENAPSNTIRASVIAGNRGHGVLMINSPGTEIRQTRIGNGPGSPAALPLNNSGHGVFVVDSAFARITDGNVIGPNSGDGVRLVGGTTHDCLVSQNYLGVDSNGTSPLGNAGAGLGIFDASDNQVGGPEDGPNWIAHNAAGVTVAGTRATNNTIRANSIHSNSGLGIDLDASGISSDGPTPNDPADADSGPNRLQNFPVLSLITPGPSSLRIEGTLDSRPLTTYTLDFYANAACDPSGHGEGRAYLGSAPVTTDAAGHAAFNLTLPVTLQGAPRLTATATDPAGNTSEFSPCVESTTYFADFNAGLPPGGTLSYSGLVPGPAVSGGVLRLTEAVGDQNNMFFLDPLGGNEPVTSFTARFRVRIDATSPNGPADGFSFSFGPQVNGTPFIGEEGVEGALRVSFDTWDNGPAAPFFDADAPAIDVFFGTQRCATVSMAGARQNNHPPATPIPVDPATDQFMVLPTGPAWADVEISLDPDGTMDVTYKGVKVLNNAQTCYVPSTGRFALGARTGGAWNTHEIDDLRITVRHGETRPPTVVQNLNDSGPGSLRDVLACATAGATIHFSPGLPGTVITLTSGELLVNKSVNIVGPDPRFLTISGNSLSRVFNVTGGTSIISGLTIRDGYLAGGATSQGGGVLNQAAVTFSNCTFFANAARGVNGANGAGTVPTGAPGNTAIGGAVYNAPGGNLTLVACSFSFNEARGGNGGNGRTGGNAGGHAGAGGSASGGAVASDGSLAVLNCTFSTNRVFGGIGGNGGLGAVFDGNGGNGGNADSGAILNRSQANLVHVTVVANESTPGGGGSGGDVGEPGTPGTARAGGIYSVGPSTLLLNSLVASNRAATGPNVSGTFYSVGRNLISSTNGSTGWQGTDLIGSIAAPLEPRLGAFGLNFGLTPTYALQPNSPAVNTGDDISLGSPWLLGTDQRGFPRRSSTHVDLGAYELCRDEPALQVTTLDDNVAGSLRAAIECLAPGGTISFAPDLGGTLYLRTGELVLEKSITLLGPGPTNLAISANFSNRIFRLTGGSSTIAGLTIRDGRNAGVMGRPGTSGIGGGILNSATLLLSNCTVAGNAAIGGDGVNGGPGGFQPAGGDAGAGLGGGIYNLGALTLARCTFQANLAAGGNGGLGRIGNFGSAGGHGGAAVGGAVCNDGTLTVLNCTFTTNHVFGGAGGAVSEVEDPPGNGGNAEGGAVANRGQCQLVHGTLAGNFLRGGSPGVFSGQQGVPGQGLGGGLRAAAGATRLLNTLVARNDARTGANAVGSVDVSGVVASDGHNLIGATEGSGGWVAGDLTGTLLTPLDPRLQPIRYHGGSTFTYALDSFSPALNAGDDSVLGMPWFLTTDQRGGPRRIGVHVDIGAYEHEPFPYLSIRLGAPGTGTVVLFWPNPSTGYGLEQTANLNAPGGGWTDVIQTPVVNGANKEVTLPATGQFRLFRLRQL